MAVRLSGVAFDRLCELAGLPKPIAEHRFAPPRRWRFDWAWEAHKVALEVQGGLFMRGGGRHSRGGALRKEHEKLNAAAIGGWRVLYVMPEQIANGSALTIVSDAIQAVTL